MSKNDISTQEATDESPRESKTCEVCGETSTSVRTIGSFDDALPRSVDACAFCAPSTVDDPTDWFQQEVQE